MLKSLHKFVKLDKYPFNSKASISWRVNDLAPVASTTAIKKHVQPMTKMIAVFIFYYDMVLSMLAVVDMSM